MQAREIVLRSLQAKGRCLFQGRAARRRMLAVTWHAWERKFRPNSPFWLLGGMVLSMSIALAATLLGPSVHGSGAPTVLLAMAAPSQEISAQSLRGEVCDLGWAQPSEGIRRNARIPIR